jgi:hypothetical protein
VQELKIKELIQRKKEIRKTKGTTRMLKRTKDKTTDTKEEIKKAKNATRMIKKAKTNNG